MKPSDMQLLILLRTIILYIQERKYIYDKNTLKINKIQEIKKIEK